MHSTLETSARVACRHDGFHSWWLRITREAQRLNEERRCDACGEVLEHRGARRYAPSFNRDGRGDAPPS